MIVTITDVRATGHCVTGIRGWFERHGIDFRDFLKNGIEADILLATGDGIALRVVGMIQERKEALRHGG